MRNLMWVFPWVFSLATCTWMYLTGPSGPYPLQQLICTMGRRWKPLEPTNWCIWNRGNLHVTVKGRKEFQFLQRCWQLAFLTLGTNIWAVLSDEQMSHGWSFPPLNDQQKKGRNKMRVWYAPTMHESTHYLGTWEDHIIPWRADTCLITTVFGDRFFVPNSLGLWDPFHSWRKFLWLKNSKGWSDHHLRFRYLGVTLGKLRLQSAARDAS